MEHGLKWGLMGVLVGFVLVYLVTPRVIPMLRRLKCGQTIREEGPQNHLEKAGTPTMGGVVIQGGIVVTVLVLGFFAGNWNFFGLALLLYFGLIGFVDDYLKVVKKHNLGLRAKEKLVLQILGALGFSLYAFNSPAIGSDLLIPFTGEMVDLGIWYIPFTFFAIVALVNAVNLTDGLDGLASGVTLIVSLFFFVGAVVLSQVATGIFIGAVIGSCMGFLRYNSNPADIFMGDTGSMALGGAIIAMAIVTKLQFFILIAGLIFVLEALSVVIQVTYFKKTGGKRFFKMAPFHHHFELSGWSETRVVTVFWIMSGLFVSMALIAFL